MVGLARVQHLADVGKKTPQVEQQVAAVDVELDKPIGAAVVGLGDDHL